MARKITATVDSENRIIVDQFKIDPANFTLGSQSNVNITSPVDRSLLVYDNSSQNWIDSQITLPSGTGTIALTTDIPSTASTVTVTDNNDDTAFPVVFNNESNALLDDTGEFTYNPNDGVLTVPFRLDLGGQGVGEKSQINFSDGNDADAFRIAHLNGDIYFSLAGNNSDYFFNTDQSTSTFEFNIGSYDTKLKITHDDTTINTPVSINSDFLEISSSTAPTADDACHPVISLYDSSDRSQSTLGSDTSLNDGRENAGAIRWYFNNDAGDKSFLGEIRGRATDTENGAERGSLEFILPSGSAQDVIADVTASHSAIESPVMTLHKYGLVLRSGNDLQLGAPDDVLKWDTGTYKQELRGRSAETSGVDSLIELPDASGTVALKGDSELQITGSGYSSDLTSKIKADNTNTATSWVYTNKTLDVSAKETNPQAIYLADSGTKLFITGASSDKIHRYTLSTPYDVSTATFDHSSTTSVGSSPSGLWVSSDGMTVIVLDAGSDELRSFSPTSAFDMTTLGTADTVRDLTSNADTNPHGFSFNNDGSKIILIGNSVSGGLGDGIYSYNLSTAYDISTISTTSGNTASAPDVKIKLTDMLDQNDPISNPRAIQFSPDGLTAHMIDTDRDDIISFRLSSAFDISTLSYAGGNAIETIEYSPHGLYVDYPNNIALLIGPGYDTVRQFTVDNDGLIVDSTGLNILSKQATFHNDVTVEREVAVNGRLYVNSRSYLATLTTSGDTVLCNVAGADLKAGHRDNEDEWEIGISEKSQTIKVHGGPTESGKTKTLELGTGGLAGSTTNIVLGQADQNNSVTINQGAGVSWTSGAGAPSHAASPGSLYTRTDGGAGTTLYVKETGVDATGWVAK